MVYVPGFSPYLQQNMLGAVAPPEMVSATMVQPTSAPTMSVLPNSIPVAPSRPTAPDMRARAMGVSDLGVRGFGSSIAANAAAANTARAAAANPLPPGLMFKTDKGASAGYGKGSSGYVAFDPAAQYRMWDERGKNKIVSSGAGEAGLRSIYELANQFNTEQGKKANYGIERLNPATGKWERILENDPAKNVLGKIADIALPVAGAFLLPGVGGILGGALGAGLGAAGGSALSSVAQGRSLGDTLMRAGISGLGAGGLSAIGGAPFIPGGGSAASGALGQAAAQAATQGAAQGALAPVIDAAGNMILTGVSGAAGGLGSAIGALGAAGGAALGAASGSGAAQPGDIVVQGTRPTPAMGSGLPFFGAGLGGMIPDVIPGQEIVVEGTRPTQPNGGAIGAGIGAGLPTVIDGPLGNEMILEGTRPVPPERNPPYPGDVPINLNTPPQISTVPVTPVQTPPVTGAASGDGGPDIIDILRAAGLLTGLAGSAIGGGGGGNGTIPAGLFSGGGDSGGLPTPNIPGLGGGTAADQRPMGGKTTQDWYRYGYGPEQSFFNYVPQAAPNTSQAYTGYAEGGEVGEFAVRGPGSGRSDEIPALLSDGEYIIDAETVALLGDGSTKEGAARLDEFRVNVRKHKGKALAKGDFSANAKQPERYMLGGKS